ncbi:tetratricopeptide repeat protein [Thiovibrio sp. JS02]
MKKNKKRIPAGLRPGSGGGGRKESDGPAPRLAGELAALLQAGKLALFQEKASEAVRRWPGHPEGWKALGLALLMQAKPAEALEALTATVGLAPGDAQAHHNLGCALLQLGRLAEAEASCRQALALKPDYAQAHNNLGIILFEAGRFAEAAASYRQALAASPDFVEAHNNLGNALKELELFAEAEASFRQALAGRPGFAEAHANLALTLLKLRRLEEAEASYRQAIALKPDYLRAHRGLAETLLRLGRAGEAAASYRRGAALDPFDVETLAGLDQALTQLIPGWHVPMMNDAPRNDAYLAALRAAVTPATQVLEIGTGSGLLAMMAAKLGAKQVTTCEAVPEIAETARAIVADNGLARTVKVVAKRSDRLEIGVDMDDRADLLVSEILSSEFLGEGVLASIEDARHRLLKPGARIIPARGAIRFALFGGADLEKNIRVGEVHGFDLSRFNDLVVRRQYISRNDLDVELLTDAASAFFFDFEKTGRFLAEERDRFALPVRKAGRCCGIIQWLRLEMDDSVVFENHPLHKNPASGWQRCVYVFARPIDLRPGQVAVVGAARNRATPWFFWEGLQ